MPWCLHLKAAHTTYAMSLEGDTGDGVLVSRLRFRENSASISFRDSVQIRHLVAIPAVLGFRFHWQAVINFFKDRGPKLLVQQDSPRRLGVTCSSRL